MKKTKKTALTAAIFAAAMNLAACETDSPEKSKLDSDVSATEGYHPEDDEVCDVYGPPADYYEADESTDAEIDVTEFDINDVQIVYGSPPILD